MLDAIVMAAGEGRRLRPVTERYAKPVLPIDGVPVAATLLRELAACCSRVTVVVGRLERQVQALLGDGSGFGLEVRYVHQPSADGSADAARRALEAGARLPVLIAGADTRFSPGDVGRFAASSRGAQGAIAVRREPPPAPPHRYAVRIEAGRVTRVLDDDPANPFAGAPLWLVGPELAPYLDGLGGPPFQLAEALQRAVDGGVEIAGIEIGPTRDLTDPVDLVVENFPYLGALDA